MKPSTSRRPIAHYHPTPTTSADSVARYKIKIRAHSAARIASGHAPAHTSPHNSCACPLLPPPHRSGSLGQSQTLYVVSKTCTRRCNVAASKPVLTAILRPFSNTTAKPQLPSGSASRVLLANSTVISPSPLPAPQSPACRRRKPRFSTPNDNPRCRQNWLRFRPLFSNSRTICSISKAVRRLFSVPPCSLVMQSLHHRNRVLTRTWMV